MRTSHERPEGMEEASTIMCGLDLEKIQTAINILEKCKTSEVVRDYSVNNFSDKIVKNILSYQNYSVNKKV